MHAVNDSTSGYRLKRYRHPGWWTRNGQSWLGL